MKKICCVLIAALFSISLSYARDYSKVKYNLETPFTGIFTAERFTGDSIDFYDEGNFNTTHGRSVYKRSEDGLRDTIFGYSGAIRVTELVYSPEGQLVTLNNLIPDPANITELVFITDSKTNYQYDAEGRIAVITTVANGNDEGSRFFDYTQNTIIAKSKNGQVTDSTYVLYTDSGYVCHVSDGSYWGNDTLEYVFDSENRLIRQVKYRPISLYGGKSETVLEYNDHGYWAINDSSKAEYLYFEKESQLKKVSIYELTIHGWEVYQTTDYVLYYGDTALDIDEPCIKKTAKIYGVAGAVVMELENPMQVTIYSISGQLIQRQYFDSGRFHIPMIPGFYIVQAGKDVFKLKVK